MYAYVVFVYLCVVCGGVLCCVLGVVVVVFGYCLCYFGEFFSMVVVLVVVICVPVLLLFSYVMVGVVYLCLFVIVAQ